jgi:hypothetical protein
LWTYELTTDWTATVYSGMTLKWNYDKRTSDASYLSVSNARSRLGGLFFLGNKSHKQQDHQRVDLEINFEHMRSAWDPQQPIESMFKQIQDCADYYEAGGVLIDHPQQINVGYAKIFATGHFVSAFCSVERETNR